LVDEPLYILLISVHGLIRAHDLELGRNADTGGQSTYVVELARALARHDEVEQVDLLTRLVDDPAVAADYGREEEFLADGARILRVRCGPARRYVHKERLWPYLDQMVDRCLHLLRGQRRLPDLIHSHYADAGYVGLQLSQLLGIPQVHTGHSLGRAKRERLLADGRKAHTIERQFNFSRRITAEEEVLRHASLVVASTQQEVEEQYGLYDAHRPERSIVIPPGIDTSRFSPPGRRPINRETSCKVDRFLSQPNKPMILTLARPEASKNLKGLMDAYGAEPTLQDIANLVIVAGTRDDIQELEPAQRSVLHDLVLDIDRHDVWGKVALPKKHSTEDVPELYRLAARRGGVFVNPSLIELFGLTLIEAAASGLPVVATENGGPRDIVANCRNGLLVDPTDPLALAEALKAALSDRGQWQRWARRGVTGVQRHYSWDAHVARYVKTIRRILYRNRKRHRRQIASVARSSPSLLAFAHRLLITDIDGTLIGDREGLQDLLAWIREHRGPVGFGVATGRSPQSASRQLRNWRVPAPDVAITSVGTEISYGSRLIRDVGWTNHIGYLWRRDAIAETLDGVPGLRTQEADNQREFKLSYYVSIEDMPPLKEVQRLLHERRLRGRLVLSKGETLDVLPIRASKGHAVRYLAYKWGIPLGDFLVAGDSGNDLEMLTGDTRAVVVGNHSPELDSLRNQDNVYFAEGRCARGILEGLGHYGLRLA